MHLTFKIGPFLCILDLWTNTKLSFFKHIAKNYFRLFHRAANQIDIWKWNQIKIDLYLLE